MASDGLWHPLLDLAVGFATPAGDIWGIPGLAAIAKSGRGVSGGVLAAKIAPARCSATAVPRGGGGFGHSVGTGAQGGFACPACGIHHCCGEREALFVLLLHLCCAAGGAARGAFGVRCVSGRGVSSVLAPVRCWRQVGLEERFAAKCPILLGFSQLEDEGRNDEAKEINAFSAIIPVHTHTK